MDPALQTPYGYPELLQELVHRIARSQTRAAMSVSRELVLLYWSIGADILLRQRAEGWGTKIIDRLGHDLQARFQASRALARATSSTCEVWPRHGLTLQ